LPTVVTTNCLAQADAADSRTFNNGAIANDVGQVALHHGADVGIEMTNGWIVELQALRGPNINLLDQITAVLVGKVGLGD
jgi:hypothetical protein